MESGTESQNSEKVHFFCRGCGQPVHDGQGVTIQNHDDLVRWLQGDIAESTQDFSGQVEDGLPFIRQERTAGPESDYLQFTCPKCGGNLLCEVTVTITVLEFTQNGTVEYGQSYYDHDEEHFQCGGCSWILQDEENNRLVTYDDLLVWIRRNQK